MNASTSTKNCLLECSRDACFLESPHVFDTKMCFNEGSVIESRWKLGKTLGSGGFGTVFEGTDSLSNDAVAIKIETGCSSEWECSLEKERDIYELLNMQVTANGGRIEGIPLLHFFRKYSESCQVLIIDRLGPSLRQVAEACGGTLSLSSVLKVGIQALRRLEFIHSKGVIHRDIKPENMLVGCEPRSRGIVHLVDFGLSTSFLDGSTEMLHIPFSSSDSKAIGTYSFASARMHLGHELSRRDDLESLGYTLFELRKGSLPWGHLPCDESDVTAMDGTGTIDGHKAHDWEDTMRRMKESTPLWQGFDNAQDEMAAYYAHVRNLTFESIPDYSYLTGLLKRALSRRNQEEDSIFEWEI